MASAPMAVCGLLPDGDMVRVSGERKIKCGGV